uniref:Uncharacterized protein n=1 Tax=Setaria viridis TaxID=4556 RepID=A0A4U6T9Y1_SETVI|nr:hypothetical protein SEVIR_9G485500v2 [Setaria viridis]
MAENEFTLSPIQEPETAAHLCQQFSYTKEVWTLVPNDDGEVERWWTRSLEPLNRRQGRSMAAYKILTAWNIWKERNRRVFEGKSQRPIQVFDMIQHEVKMR